MKANGIIVGGQTLAFHLRSILAALHDFINYEIPRDVHLYRGSSVINNDCTIECRRFRKLYEVFYSAGSHILFRPEHMCATLFPGTADQLSIRLLIFSYKRKVIF